MSDLDLKAGAKMRMEMLKMQHREKMDMRGVAVQAHPSMPHINLERAYKAHHEGADMKSVMIEMGMPREFA